MNKILAVYVKALAWRTRCRDAFAKVLKGEEGATVAEYALILAVVVIGLITVLASLRTKLVSKITEITNQIENASGTTPGT